MNEMDDAARIEQLKVAWACEWLRPVRQLSGKSGARLYLVDMKVDNYNGHAILKVSNADLSNESNRQKRALELSRKFGAAHFPQVIRFSKCDQGSALLMTVAGHGLLFTSPFSSINKSSFRLVAAQAIAAQVLEEWNADAGFSENVSTATQFLQRILGHRIDPGGRLPNLIEDLYGVSADAEGFEMTGLHYPNPFAFAASTKGLSVNIKLNPILGFMHGDFHGWNVLVSEFPPSASEFYIIDFDSFEEGSPLLFDHAYFELSYLLKQRENAVLERWVSLLESLEGVEETGDVVSSLRDAEDQGHVWCAAMMRSAISSWQAKRFPERKEDIKKQLLLSRIAAGLNFAQKTKLDSAPLKSDKLKEFALLYAAANLRSLLKFTKHEAQITYIPVQRAAAGPKATTAAWRDVWDACDGFNDERNVFLLIAGPALGDQSEYTRAAMALVPWSMVIDFDSGSDKGRLLSTVREAISTNRGFHLALPEQTPALTFARGTCWLMVNGWNERADTIKRLLPDWRRYAIPSVRDLAQRLKSEIAPRPVKIVVMGEGIDAPKLRAVCTALEEALPNSRVIVVTNADSDAAFDYISAEVSHLHQIKCGYADMSVGIHRMVGEFTLDDAAYIPMRDAKGVAISRMRIDPPRLALFSESFELVYDAAAYRDAKENEHGDFFRGNTITWRELDLGLDVPREVTTSLAEHLKERTSKSRSTAVALEHTPGAGGTTVARRIAWSLRNTFPTVILNRYIDTTGEMLEWIGQQTGLPLLLVIERRDLSDAERDHLFRDLKGRYVRFVFLDVRRAIKPRDDGISTFALRDPMSASEAELFYDRYSRWASKERQKALKQLVSDQKHREFRSAFFFGFYVFEEKFVRVRQFVAAHVAGLTAVQREVVARLALISRYSQSRLPLMYLPMLADTALPETIDVDDLLGSAKRLTVFDASSLSIIHPIIAEEVLANCLTANDEKQPWRTFLADFCVGFVKSLGRSPEAYGESIEVILTQLFLERSIWDDTNQPRAFSNLIETIPTKEGQRRVLECLCDTFPSNAHFWNHLGRHLNLRIRAPYVESEKCFLRAIELESKNEIHHHGLGMVYRVEVRSRLEKPLDRSQTLLERIAATDLIFDQAEQCFRTAHALDSGNEYPLVTHIQLILESIERVFNLSGERKYQNLLNRPDEVGSWCRRKLQRAESLLADLKQLQAESEPSKYTIECESRLVGLYGNFEGMVRGFTELLNRDDVNKRSVRRLIATCHIRQNRDDFDRIDVGVARRIVEMMLDNLAENPGNGADIRLWLRAFRVLPEFTVTEALERVGTWAVLSDALDAHYYLYLLHYVHLERGAHGSLDEVKKNIELCRRKAPLLISKRSFEWWASEKLKRKCPLVHHSELSGWDRGSDFWSNGEKLGEVEGIIDQVRSQQQGHILLHGLPVFFVPARTFGSTDVNTKVRFHLGFSYEGLRAWNVKSVKAEGDLRVES